MCKLQLRSAQIMTGPMYYGPVIITGLAVPIKKNKINFGGMEKVFYLYRNKNTMKIISSRITEQPKSLFDPMPRVYVTLEDGNEVFLFEYYPDEISFTPSEFIGLTIEECRTLKFKKDRNYLTT
jgi:hypothetical protein